MAKTFIEQDYKNGPLEPIFSRSRKNYRGHRSSSAENLESNSLIVDFNRINLGINRLEFSIENINQDLVSNFLELTTEQILNNGIDYAVTEVRYAINKESDVYGSDEKDMILETLSKLSITIKKIQSKISRLENGH